MPKLNLDFSGVPNQWMDPGVYEGTITEVTLKQGANAPYLNWEIEITDESVPDQIGRKVFFMTTMSQNALWTLKQTCEAFGFESVDDWDYDEQSGLLTNPDFTGVPVRIKTSINVYNGQKRTRVDSIVEALGEPVFQGELPLDYGDPDEDEEFDDNVELDEEDIEETEEA